MAVFISVTTNSFQATFDRQVAQHTRRPKVRRPTRGITLKADSYAYLRVVRSDGEPIRLFDGGAKPLSGETATDPVGTSVGTTSFMLQQITEQRMEKQQVVETFGEDYIFFFGEKPRFVSFVGTLLNTQDFNWKNEFQKNYEEYFRGTRLLELDARVYITFDDNLVEGYITNSAVSLETEDPHEAPFSFQMFVTNHTTVGGVTGAIKIPSPVITPSLPSEKEVVEAEKIVFRTKIGEKASGGIQRRKKRRADRAAKSKKDSDLGRVEPPKYYYDRKDEYISQGGDVEIYDQSGSKVDPMFRDKAKAELEERFGIKSADGSLSGAQIASKAITDLSNIGVKAYSLSNQSLLTGPNAFVGIGRLGSFGLGRATGEIAEPFQTLVGV